MYGNTLYHSDHLIRRMVSTTPPLKVDTLNMLCFCYSKSNSKWGFSNNPLDLDETPDEYIARKRVQLESILASDADFYLLQEADIFFDDFEDDLKSRVQELRSEFNTKLDDRKLVTFEAKELVIIYSSKYELLSTTTHLNNENKWNPVDCLLMASFAYSDTKITIGTFHGNFGTDYTVSIPALLSSIEDVTVIGGDTNHPSDYGITGVLTTGDCTNFYPNSDGSSVFLDHRSKSVKDYDGFIVKGLGVVTVSGQHVWEMIDGSVQAVERYVAVTH